MKWYPLFFGQALSSKAKVFTECPPLQAVTTGLSAVKNLETKIRFVSSSDRDDEAGTDMNMMSRSSGMFALNCEKRVCMAG